MTWNRTDPMHERHLFIRDYQGGLYSTTELADRYGISRKTAYKWINRFATEGSTGLIERSRAPKASPAQVAPDIVALVLQTRKQHPTWGARTLRIYLTRRHPELTLPAASTIAAMLGRHGLVTSSPRQRRSSSPTEAVQLIADVPNDVWCIDFKGEFLLGNRCYCYPLTITDAHSRYLLVCDAFDRIDGAATRRSMVRVFQEHGLPRAIRSDNGAPFASRALAGLSRLNVWWMKLGILHQRIMPGHPEQNGRHERMHRTLKAETTRPPESSLHRQQQRFDQWRWQYNEERPHQGIGGACPGDLYDASPRVYPQRLPTPQYAGHCEVRLVSGQGSIRFKTVQIFLSSVLGGERVGLEEVDDGIWNVLFYNLLLGRLDERTMRIG